MHNYTKVLIFLSLVIVGNAAAEEIIVEGGGAATSAIFLPMKDQFEKTTGDRLTIIYSSPVKGLVSLEKGVADIVTAATPLPDMIMEAALQGVKIDPDTLYTRQIGINRTVIFVHSYNSLKELSKEQLKDIFTGKITNWKDVGGDNEEITVVWEKGSSGQKLLFTREILDGKPVTPKAIPATDYYNIRDIVSKTSGAIGIAPQGLVSSMVSVPNAPELMAPIIVITKGEPSAKVKRLLEYYKNEYSFLDTPP
jgi:phosphate transport system substrate-binding protein